MHPPITIALATYNGSPFLREQLASIAAQSDDGWNLLVSDDGSTDGTLDMIAEFGGSQPAHKLRVIDGPGKGATRNFLHLIGQADPDGWFAFCDQDDVWRPEKLALAARYLEGRDGPAVYAARTTICDESLNVLTPAPHYARGLHFRNALIQACMPGNTIVANSAALRLMQKAAPYAAAANVVSHDWWTYQLMSAAGAQITRDAAQVLFYRQHRGNLMGRNDTSRAKAARLSMLFDGTFAGWIGQNQEALAPVADLMTAGNRVLFGRFDAAVRSNGAVTAAAFLQMGLYRQTRAGTAALMAAALAGRLRQPREI